MIRSLFKTIYWLLHLTLCLFWLWEKWQPARLPSLYGGPRLLVARPPYRQNLARLSPPARPRLFSWRRLLFLLS